ncbi:MULTISPECIES: hypothetical protein [Sphingomonas]|uniref:Uncharacterized protein n=2 Tax=Sphingomonas paucimobilis TaxID=13689 RepID=A0A411LHH1_SPHPI|nr:MULTISPECIES: hypothetical protein [Sphingomonas]MBQ1481138.1 hypothetical protein [Sphingomonas sp.]NNG57496.1 hypothetical protein [Sphingomonas paucimobilis]QBE91759.1 hypothetical protein DRN02_006820 [Sphingomonas paucimobilis]QPS16836.1 hypothetical protein I6G65_04095 [Sphingomonas paucimobilis]QPT08310.1 hypothetical protein I6G38_16490 [Sphingomonas paucimobilis]
MLPTALILIAAICQGLGAWAALAGALALACRLDPASIGLPAITALPARCGLWALLFAIGITLTIAGSALAVHVIGAGA